jgi:hypothetical protein
MNNDTLIKTASTSLFAGKITAPQRDGILAIVAGWDKYGYGLDTGMAYVLATAYHETGQRMVAVRETFASTDAQAKSRLTAAFKKGQMKWVKEDYWSFGWYGRGLVQLTHEENYSGALREAVLKEFPGKDIHATPDLALDPAVAVFILIEGVTKGVTVKSDFTKYALEDFINADKTDYPNARKTVNPGELDSYQKIAGYALKFESAIRAARLADGEDFKGPAENIYDGRSYVAVKNVQQLLLDKKYTDVGTPDGKWGTKTRGAVLAFRADNGLPLEPTITDTDFLAALATSDARLIAPARAEATVADLRRDGSKTILHADRQQLMAAGTAAAGGIAVVNKTLDQVDQYSATLQRVAGWVHPFVSMVTTNLPLILISVGGFVAWQAWKIKKAKVEAHQEGKLA